MKTTMRAMVGLGMALAMTAGSLGAMAQDDSSASPLPEATEIPPRTPSGRPDLYLDMPYYIGGFEPEISMTRGEEHFANLPQDDPMRVQLEGMLEAIDADAEDMVSGYALVSLDDFFAFVVGVRVDGVEPGTLAPAYLPILIGNLIDPSQSLDQLGGKEVITVVSEGEAGEPVELYVYDEGDTVWMVQGPRDIADITIEGLPDPLSDR